MRTPIKPSEIRKGDLVRVEWVGSDSAEEWRSDGKGTPYREGPTKLFLLDRPAPPVGLPTEPTLGWLTYAGTTIFGQFCASEEVGYDADEIAADSDERHVNSYGMVTAFLPATAVPKKALERLRHRYETRGLLIGDLTEFFAAVDKAGGQS